MVGDCDWTSVEVGNKLLIFCILIPLPILVLRTPPIMTQNGPDSNHLHILTHITETKDKTKSDIYFN
jgi:hypothetical protein